MTHETLFLLTHKSETPQNRDSILLILTTNKNLNSVKEPSKNQPTPGVVWGMECLPFFFFFKHKTTTTEDTGISTGLMKMICSLHEALGIINLITNLKEPSSIAQIVLIDLEE